MTAEASPATITSTAVKRSSVSHCSRSVSTGPHLARREVVEHHDAARLDEVDDLVDADLGRGAGVEEEQGERTPVVQHAPVGGEHLDLRVVVEDLGGRAGERLVELRGQDPRPVAYAAAQPRGAHAAPGAELGHGAAAGRRQGRQQPAGLVAAEGHVAGGAAHVEGALDDVGEIRGSTHETAECAT